MKPSPFRTYQHPLIAKGLTKKYSNYNHRQAENCGIVAQHLIDNLIAPSHFISQSRINFQEIEYNSDKKQYLKRFYSITEYMNKTQALTQYYKYSKNYPYHIDLEIGLIMMDYQEKRNKQHRKFIKRLMNEPIQETSSQKSYNSHSRQETNDGKRQFSWKLKGLDSEQSSLMLQQICEKINNAFPNVKPLYFYKGVYNDHVKEFKQFLLEGKRGKKSSCQEEKLKQKKKQENGEESMNQIANINKGKENLFPMMRRFDSTRQFRKTLTNFAPPPQMPKKLKRQPTFTKFQRNKTVTIKPQSFSKTNETVSKDQNNEQMSKKRAKSQVRIRKCKSVAKSMLTRNKSIVNFIKLAQNESRNKQNEQRNQRKDFNSKTKKPIHLQHFESKQNIKINQKTTIQRSISRNISKKAFSRLQPLKQSQKPSGNPKSKAIIDLIRNKLKLRG